MEDNERDAERFESIPWSSLLPEENDRRARWLGIGAAIVLALVAGLVAVRLFGSTTPGTVVAVDPAPAPLVADGVATASSSSVAAISPAEPETVTGGDVTQTPGPKVGTEGVAYSEADLMAAAPDLLSMRPAVMRAEWFVTDFFTVDADATAEPITAALGSVAGVTLPHESPGGVSYVEWARAYAVEELPGSGYRVAIAFRTLSGPLGGEVTRRPVRAVEVDVAVESGGATAVLDLPRPVPIPAQASVLSSAAATGDVGSGEIPDEIEAAALAAARATGGDVELLSASPRGGGWRFVVAVVDDSGMAFPMSVWLPVPE